MSKKLFEYAGVAASVILIAFGIGAVIAGSSGRSTVRDNLAKEQIVGTPDMTPKAIAAEAKAAGLKNVDLPTCSVAGKAIDNGSTRPLLRQLHARPCARGHRGQVYAEMARYIGKDGKPTDDVKQAAQSTRSPASRRQRGAHHLDQRDRAGDRAQHRLLRRERGDVLDHHGRRTAPHRHRVAGPDARAAAQLGPPRIAAPSPAS